MVNPGVMENTGDVLVQQLLRMGVSDLTIGSLTSRPTPGSVEARILRLLIFDRAAGPAGPTPWGTIGERTLARGWASPDFSISKQVISGPPLDRERQLRAGQGVVLVPRVPEEQLYAFAWNWFLDMTALLDIRVTFNRQCEPAHPSRITPGTEFNYRWGVINRHGDSGLSDADGLNAGVEGLLFFAQQPIFLLDAFRENLGHTWHFRGLRTPAWERQPEAEWGWLKFSTNMQGGVRRLHLELTTTADVDSPLHHCVTSRVLL